jgi:hypothetical protein
VRCAAMSAECPNCGQSWGAEQALSNSERHVAELEAKVARLTSRGIEDMHARIAGLTALLLELSGHPGAPAWLRGRIDSFMAETPR